MIHNDLVKQETTFQAANEFVCKAKSYEKEDRLIKRALKCLEARVKYISEPLTMPFATRHYLRLRLGKEPNEMFTVIFLATSHHVIACEDLFFGTVNTTTVHTRVIAQRALFHNASAVILAHNHPSGELTPSSADQYITQQIKQALIMFDVRVLDHIIVSPYGEYSFIENGLL